MRWLELRLRDLKHQQRRYEAKLDHVSPTGDSVKGAGASAGAPPVLGGAGNVAAKGEASILQVCSLLPLYCTDR